MENKKQSAFPLMDVAHATGNEFYRGMSKHEYAAIMIAQGLVASTTTEEYIGTEKSQQVISELSYSIAAKVLDKFKNS